MTAAITIDKTKAVLAGLRALTQQRVLVGIPESAAARNGDPENNAAIGYLMETGSPAQNLPARPFLVPGVKNAEKRTAAILKLAGVAALAGNAGDVTKYLDMAGLAAASAVKAKIQAGPFTPLSPSTVAARAAARGTKSQRKSEITYAALIAIGETPGDAQAMTGIKPLINTGQLRNSITYVIRKTGGNSGAT